jgi:hypothetical protein
LNQLEVATIDDKLRMACVTFNKEDFKCIDFSAVYYNKRTNLNLRSKSQFNESPKNPKSDLNLNAPVFSPRNKDLDYSTGNQFT